MGRAGAPERHVGHSGQSSFHRGPAAHGHSHTGGTRAPAHGGKPPAQLGGRPVVRPEGKPTGYPGRRPVMQPGGQAHGHSHFEHVRGHRPGPNLTGGVQAPHMAPRAPIPMPTSYAQLGEQVRGMSNGDLSAREKKRRAQFKDAVTGPHKDMGKAAELRAQLDAVNSEQRARKSA